MSQILSQVPRHLLQQQQRLTPQLIQAMDILQLPTMALDSRIAQELDNNPALELASSEPAADQENAPTEDTDPEPTDGEETLVVRDGDAKEFERLDSLVREYGWNDDEFGYTPTRSRARSAEESDAKLEAMSNTAARPIGLQEYLLGQWSLTDANERMRSLGASIIEALEETGRLATPLEQIGRELDPPPEIAEMEAALAGVQQLDPPGLAARSLQECLVLQLAALPGDNDLERRIIEEHFENLQKNRLPAIAHGLGVDLDDVTGAIEVISQLAMHPGEGVLERAAPPIVPDVLVDQDDDSDRYVARLARESFRELRISPEFREALERARGDKKTREFIKEKIEAANAIIDAVRFRKQRLLEVAQAVVDAQRDFLDRGEQHMKVLRMSELADRFDCDPSTISRTVDQKWIQTPRGIYPLRKFFTGGTESGNGEVLGWDSIKAKVQEIIASEDKSSPLSDDLIVNKLKTEGIEIKRRTVAKYRSQLDIPSARQRRQY